MRKDIIHILYNKMHYRYSCRLPACPKRYTEPVLRYGLRILKIPGVGGGSVTPGSIDSNYSCGENLTVRYVSGCKSMC